MINRWMKETTLKGSLRTLSPFLQRHSIKVAVYSEILAQALWEQRHLWQEPVITEELVRNIRRCAYYHDVGKAFISNRLWEVPGALSEEEYALVKTHPVLGAAAIVEKIDARHTNSDVDPVRELMKACCLYHHERWDGTGYPFGCAGERIPLAGRIVAIADAFDSMTAVRPYMVQKTWDEAIEELSRCAGSQFDPALIPVFIEAMGCDDALCYG